ncbi:MAG: Ig domain-containing protein [Acidimicrobiales bacterium]
MSIVDSAIEGNTILPVRPVPTAAVTYSFYGAGIYNEGQLTIEDSTVAGNKTLDIATTIADGGGIFNISQSMTLLHSSIVGNVAGNAGGGIYEGIGFFGASPQMVIGASIVAGNGVGNGPSSPQNCALAAGASAPTSLGYNVTDTPSGGGCGFTGRNDLSGAAVNLQLSFLSSHDSLFYGSRTYGVLAPGPGSPGTGNIPFGASLSDGSLACPGLDQLGNQRPVAGSDVCDSGAIETGSSAVTPLPPSITSASITTFTVGEAGTFSLSANASPPAAFSAPSGTLPSGVSLSPSGDLSGTPALGAVGTYRFSVIANNSVSPSALQSFILTVAKEPSTTTLMVTPTTVGSSGGTLKAAVSVTARGETPTGTAVVELPSGSPLCTATLSGGSGSCAGSLGSGIPVGTMTVLARYSGDANTVASTGSGSVSVTSGPPPVTVPSASSGYWEVASNGGVFSFGTARFYGSMAGHVLNRPVVAMAATPDGHGYWLVCADGGVFSFGDAGFFGSEPGMAPSARSVAPVVGIAATPDGKGYWEVTSTGKVLAFGDAHLYGSMAGHVLTRWVVGIAATPDGHGYWLVGADGGIFAFGDARFHGSMAAKHFNTPVVGIAAS